MRKDKPKGMRRKRRWSATLKPCPRGTSFAFNGTARHCEDNKIEIGRKLKVAQNTFLLFEKIQLFSPIVF